MTSLVVGIGAPTRGDDAVGIEVAKAVNGMGLARPSAPIVVPANIRASAVLMACPTMLDGSVGSTTIEEALPPKSVRL